MKLASVVTLFYPEENHLKNINYYLDGVDKLFVINNTPSHNYQKELPKSKKITYFDYDNIGVAKALNIGAQKAIEAGYNYLLTMDQDTVLPISTLNEMKSVIEKENMNNIGIITPWHKTKLKEEKPKTKIDYPRDVMTSGNILNLAIWQKIGKFNEDFFIDGIDIEYGLRLKKHNYKIMRLNYLEIDHDLGDIFYVHNKLCTNHNGLRRYYMNRNYHYIYDIYYDTDKEFCEFLISNYKTILKVLLFEKHKFSKVYGFILGYSHYKRNIKGKLNRFLFKKM